MESRSHLPLGKENPSWAASTRYSAVDGYEEVQYPPLIAIEELVIGSELGRGVFGQVFKGTLRGSVVAVKQLKDKLKDLTQFETEITIMTKIRHPNVVLFMGASFDPPLIVTEYLEGGDLHETIVSYHAKLENRDLIPIADAVKLAVGIAKGMSWLHQSIPPIIHKDLKPKNVMIDSHGTPKIIDFGLSEIQTQREIEKKKIAGSASWMAPEMLKGDVYTEKLDVYAFGIMIWQLFTGSIKVYDTTKYDGLQANVAFQAFINDICDQRMRPPIPSFLKSSHPHLVPIVESCWGANPDQRPSFSKVVQLLEKSFIETVLQDEHAVTMWEYNFKDKQKVPVGDLVKTLFETCKLEYPHAPNHENMLKLRALEAVIVDSPNVTIERFGLLLHWFGPILPKYAPSNIFDKITALVSSNWFHGELSGSDAQKILMADNDKFKRDFLIRTSTNLAAPFVLSRIEAKKGKSSVFHHRINFNKITGEYSMKMLEDKVIKGDSLENFIKNCKAPLAIKKPVKCKKYLYLANLQNTPASYV